MEHYRVVQELVENRGLIVDGETGAIYSTRIQGKKGSKVLLKGSKTSNGYTIHRIVYKQKRYHIRAHRIVWYALKGDIPDDLMIDHIDRNKKNNAIDNLRIVDMNENLSRREIVKGEDNGSSKITCSDVIQIRKRYAGGESLRDIARGYSVGKTQVHNIVTGQSWKDCNEITNHQFPAPRNVPQYEWEPSRTTDRKDNRRQRIKALGNAVVPQVIYPIAQEIHKYLKGQI